MPTTSVYMSSKTKIAVLRAASRLAMPQRDIVVMLLMRMMEDAPLMKRAFDTVKYQPDDPDGRWHTFCIKFKGDEYEFFTDMRKHCKCTVSLLLAMAVNLYLVQIVEKAKKRIFNYFPYHGYLTGHAYFGGLVFWISCWGGGQKQENCLSLPPRIRLFPVDIMKSQ
jgi:hypothetical protein